LPIRALATDYDGTLASDGVVHRTTLEALVRVKASGRKLLMVTGRELPDLQSVFPDVGLFDAVIAENGALLYRPGRAEELLGPPPPPALIDELKRRKVEPLAAGRSIVATLRSNAAQVAAAIEALEMPWRMIFNKDSVMLLPEGVDKGSGFVAAVRALRLTPDVVVGVGDAENDLPFLAACGPSAAVANALPALKAAADLVTVADEGEGVSWLIGRLLDGGLDDFAAARWLSGSATAAGSS
jgi:hydroxymethylpyrimidine pyrophosphatase-like HAD family hydrolase